MKKALSFGLLTVIFLLSGCFEAEMCRPVYTPTGSLGFEDLADMPIMLKVNDGRTEKIFFKHAWLKYSDPDSEKHDQPVKLEKSPQAILKDSIERALTGYGYVVTEDAPMSIDINLMEFLYTCDTTDQFFVSADIKFDVTVKNLQRIITQGLFSEHTKKNFDGFRQLQDAEPLLSKCLSTIVEDFASDKAILNAVRKGYGKEITD